MNDREPSTYASQREGVGISEVDINGPDEAVYWTQARAGSRAFPASSQDDGYTELGFGHGAGTSEQEELATGFRQGVEKLEYLTHHGSSPVINEWTVGLHAFDYNTYSLGLGTRDEDAWKITDPTHRIVERAVADRLGLWGTMPTRPSTPKRSPTPKAPRSTAPTPTRSSSPSHRPSKRSGRSPSTTSRATTSSTHQCLHQTRAVHRAKWLPAPTGPFRLVFRLYNPRAVSTPATRSHRSS